MDDLEIVLASPKDRDWAAELMARSQPWKRLGVSREQCVSACHDPLHKVYLARCRGQLAGFIILHYQGVAGAPYIKSICIDENFRNQRVGERMIHFAEELFLPVSRHLFLCVSSFNKRAQSFYHRLGYEQVGEFKDFIIQGESEILMYKRLH